MINRHLQLDLDDAEPGMILSNTLFDAHGGVLLPSGVELTESVLTSLRRRGIDQITVVNDRISEADLAIERARLQKGLDNLFRNSIDRGASNSLKESVMQYRMGDNS
ncbi:MAG TPA: hypothetical protein VK832_06815 [Burkholderiaceae bacterium]|nr:hypothetical protein [Burkholderiaceae bacterium]